VEGLLNKLSEYCFSDYNYFENTVYAGILMSVPNFTSSFVILWWTKLHGNWWDSLWNWLSFEM